MQKLTVVVLACIMIISGGCTVSNEQKVRKAVEDYNQVLIKVMATGNVDLLSNVALDQEVRRMQLFLEFLNGEHKIMNADLKEISFTDTRQVTTKSKDGKNTFVYYQVYTNELWEYKYLDAKNLTVKEGPSKVKYKTIYDVVHPTGKQNWVVYKVNFQEQLP